MQEQGRRTRWGAEIQNLFGAEFYGHVTYYDVVGCSFSSVLNTVVITDTHVYIYPLGSKKRPDPYCLLTEISEITSDHETPKNFRAFTCYDPHRIVYKLRNEYHALYTFETGSDLYWRLEKAVESAKRHIDSQQDTDKLIDVDKIKVITVDGKTITIHNHYVQKFNRIASHVIHERNIEARISKLAELQELSNEYFPIRIIFFQSSTLVQYLMDTLSFLSNFNTVPLQMNSDRVQQVTLIKSILETFQFYLKGSSSVREALRLISFNSGKHYKTLISTMFNVEFYILSQQNRGKMFLKHVVGKEAYFEELQAIEMIVPSLCYTLYGLGNIVTRPLKDGSDIFLNEICANASRIITGGFHTIAYMTIQMGYLIKEGADLPPTFSYTFYDHIWFLNYIARNFTEAVRLLKDNFAVDINMVLTDERISEKNFPDFPLFSDLKNALNNLKKMIRDLPDSRGPMRNLPVQFK